MKLPNFAKAAGVGTAVLLLSAGAAFSATATTAVNVRTGPGTGYNAVDTLSRGEQVAIVDRNGGWCAVQKTGPDGWVACRYLTNSERRVIRNNDGPSVSLSFGYGIRDNDRPRRNNNKWWNNNDRWDDNDRYWDNDWDGPRRGGGTSFGFSISN